MNKLVRALIAGWGAKKIGGGCISTIIVFIIIYYALGTCNSHAAQTIPQKNSGIQLPMHTTAKIFSLQIMPREFTEMSALISAKE